MRRLASATLVALTLCGCSASGFAPAPVAQSAATRLQPNSLPLTPLNAPASIFPNATQTEPTGIRGNLITAIVDLQGGGSDGAVYSQSKKTWVSLQFPGASSTAAYGPDVISGKRYLVVGSYQNSGQSGTYGFIYDSAVGGFQKIAAPSKLCAPKACNYTIAHSVYGRSQFKVVGNYDAVQKSPPVATAPLAGHAFLYDLSKKSFKTIDIAGALSTTAYGIWIDGNTIAVAGGYKDKKGVTHAYVRDLNSSKMLTYTVPKSVLTHFEGITGSGGAGNYNVVGDYTDLRNKAVYGFFLEISGWKAGPSVVIGKVSANSVYDRSAIGIYNPGSGVSGYIVTIPAIDPP